MLFDVHHILPAVRAERQSRMRLSRYCPSPIVSQVVSSEMHQVTLSLYYPHISYLTPHISHLTPHISHLTSHTSHLTPHTSSLAADTNIMREAKCGLHQCGRLICFVTTGWRMEEGRPAIKTKSGCCNSCNSQIKG